MLSKVRQFLAKVYIQLFHYRITALQGILFLFFYKIIYPNLIVGVNLKIWGKFYIYIYFALQSHPAKLVPTAHDF